MANKKTRYLQVLGEAGKKDHSQLTNRDLADQHPISSITGLKSALAKKADGMEIDDDGLVYLTSDKVRVAGPFGPFSSGPANGADFKVSNTTGWLYTSVSETQTCTLSFTWSSVEDELSTGKGTLQIFVANVPKSTMSIEQGDVSVDVSHLLTVGSNSVKMVVTDAYGNTKPLNFTIEVVSLSIKSTFDGTTVYTGDINYFYVPVGAVEKTVYFLLDGEEIGTQTVMLSNQQQDFTIPAQAHGAHTFEVYFTATFGEATVESNHLYYDLICVESDKTTPIIASTFKPTAVEQYDTFVIPYRVYVPASLTAEITLIANDVPVQELTVDRTEHQWSYVSDIIGDLTLAITCGDVVKTFTVPVTESSITITPVTNKLSLDLSSYGRSNLEDNPYVWENNGVSAEFDNFNGTSDLWQLDNDGVTVMRVGGDARLTIPLKLFESDLRTTGKTIEIEFATRAVLNYNATIVSCMDGGRGLSITSQQALAASAQSSIGTQYKEEEHIRLSFVIEKRTGSKMMLCYLNGICSGSVAYPDDDDFAQVNPVEITIGSSECTIDLYHIRVYDNDLTRQQILNNWIADTQTAVLKKARWERNNIYDAYGNVVIEKLPYDLPYLVLSASVLPQYKGDKKTCDGYYVDPVDSKRSFKFTGAQIDVQGTSSQYYVVKNYKIKFNGGFVDNDNKTSGTYAMNDTAVPTNTFTFKADVASSEGANNVVLAKLYNDLCPTKTPAQEADKRVRQTIDGHPIVIFWDSGSGPVFLGKYNFNNDKGTEEVFGFTTGDESWEILQNGTDRVGFKSADFSQGSGWTDDFEARYPEDNTDTTKLQAFISWVASTNREEATDETLDESVTYGDVTYTSDSADYRLAKFVNELPNWADVDDSVFYYLFTLVFLCIDQREKNAFPTWVDAMKLWIWLFYDADSTIGIDNKGKLAFDPFLEDIDNTDAGDPVFNGQANVFWTNIRLGFPAKIETMYQGWRTDGLISYDIVNGLFDTHQGKWSEAIFNEDSYNKYLEPWINDTDSTYLSMNLGKKELHRAWWLFNRFRYLDSKWVTGTSMEKRILIRAHALAPITLMSYVKMYGNVFFNALRVSKRMEAWTEYDFEWTASGAEDAVIGINDADMIVSLGDLSQLMIETIDLSGATHLTYLKLGDSTDGYENKNLVELTLGNNALLKTIDVRNCTALTQSVDVSGCTNVEEIYFDNTAITGLSLPNGGSLKKLHLPETVVNLTLRNQTALTEFEIPSFANVTTLWLENNSNVIDPMAILEEIPEKSRVRITGFDWSFDDPEDILSFYDLLDTMRGMDENGNNVDKAQVSGTVRVDSITGAQLGEMMSKYPSITVVYNSIISYLYFYDDTGTKLLYTASVANGGDGVYGGSTPSKSSTAQYTYTYAGWSTTIGGPVDPNALTAVTIDRKVYAVFTATVRTYTVYYYNGSTLLQTYLDVPYGSSVSYTGSLDLAHESGDSDYVFTGVFSPTGANITGNTTCYAEYKYTGSVSRKLVQRTISGKYTNDRVISVGNYAFAYCTALTSAEFQVATKIGSGAFLSCSKLSTVDFPVATTIGKEAFYECSALTTADFPLVTSIGDSAFASCSKLTTANFPSAITLEGSFPQCTSLSSVNFPLVTTISDNVFYNSLSLTMVNFPSVTTIGGSALRGCYALRTAEFPLVTAIKDTIAFQQCRSLTALIIRSETMCTLANANAFQDCNHILGTTNSTYNPNGDKDGYIYVPSALVETYKTATNWSTYATQFRALEDYTVDGTITGALDETKI